MHFCRFPLHSYESPVLSISDGKTTTFGYSSRWMDEIRDDDIIEFNPLDALD